MAKNVIGLKCAAVVAMASMSGTAVIGETFDNGMPRTWSVETVPASSTATASVIAVGSEKVLKLSDTDSGGKVKVVTPDLVKEVGTAQTITTAVDFLTLAGAAGADILTIDGTDTPGVINGANPGNKLVYVQIPSNNVLRFQDGTKKGADNPSMAITANTWYRLTVIVNLAADTYDASLQRLVDNTRIGALTGVAFDQNRKAGAFRHVQLGTQTSATPGDIYYDRLVVSIPR